MSMHSFDALDRELLEIITEWKGIRSTLRSEVVDRATEVVLGKLAPWAAGVYSLYAGWPWPDITMVEKIAIGRNQNAASPVQDSLERIFGDTDHIEEVAPRLVVLFACASTPEVFGKVNPWFEERVKNFVENRMVLAEITKDGWDSMHGPYTTASGLEQRDSSSYRTVDYPLDALKRLRQWISTHAQAVRSKHAAPTKAKPRGRPKADPETMAYESGVVERWKQAHEFGISLAQFAIDEGITEQELKWLIDRVRHR